LAVANFGDDGRCGINGHQALRLKWLAERGGAIVTKRGEENEPTTGSMLCSRHFLSIPVFSDQAPITKQKLPTGAELLR
jgi:hypothetical protein